MTKARTIADLGTGFVNISDTGTEGTKVASGTSAQRGSTTGQWRYNTTLGLFEGRNASEFKLFDTAPTVTGFSASNFEQILQLLAQIFLLVQQLILLILMELQ